MIDLSLTSATTRRRPPIQAVLDQHVDEAMHRWRRREATSSSRHLVFQQRMREDEMLSAHLHALWIAGVEAERTAFERCRRDSAAHRFVLTWARLAAHHADVRVLDDCLRKCGNDVASLNIVCEALRWLPASIDPIALVSRLLPSLGDAAAACALVRLCARQQWPVDATVLRRALVASSHAMRAAAYEYCASLGRKEYLDSILEEISTDGAAEGASLAAARAGLRLGDRHRALHLLWREATLPAAGDEALEFRHRDSLVDLCAALPLTRGREVWEDAQNAGAPVERLLAAAEASNDPRHLPWLVRHFDAPAIREAATNAMTWLLVDADAETADGRLDDLANTAELEAWLRARHWPVATQRWLGGRPMRKDGVFNTLLHGPLRFRQHAARHLALVAPGSPDLDTQAPAASQLHWLYEAELALDGETHA